MAAKDEPDSLPTMQSKTTTKQSIFDFSSVEDLRPTSDDENSNPLSSDRTYPTLPFNKSYIAHAPNRHSYTMRSRYTFLGGRGMSSKDISGSFEDLRGCTSRKERILNLSKFSNSSPDLRGASYQALEDHVTKQKTQESLLMKFDIETNLENEHENDDSTKCVDNEENVNPETRLESEPKVRLETKWAMKTEHETRLQVQTKTLKVKTSTRNAKHDMTNDGATAHVQHPGTVDGIRKSELSASKITEEKGEVFDKGWKTILFSGKAELRKSLESLSTFRQGVNSRQIQNVDTFESETFVSEDSVVLQQSSTEETLNTKEYVRDYSVVLQQSSTEEETLNTRNEASFEELGAGIKQKDEMAELNTDDLIRIGKRQRTSQENVQPEIITQFNENCLSTRESDTSVMKKSYSDLPTQQDSKWTTANEARNWTTTNHGTTTFEKENYTTDDLNTREITANEMEEKRSLSSIIHAQSDNADLSTSRDEHTAVDEPFAADAKWPPSSDIQIFYTSYRNITTTTTPQIEGNFGESFSTNKNNNSTLLQMEETIGYPQPTCDAHVSMSLPDIQASLVDSEEHSDMIITPSCSVSPIPFRTLNDTTYIENKIVDTYSNIDIEASGDEFPADNDEAISKSEEIDRLLPYYEDSLCDSVDISNDAKSQQQKATNEESYSAKSTVKVSGIDQSSTCVRKNESLCDSIDISNDAESQQQKATYEECYDAESTVKVSGIRQSSICVRKDERQSGIHTFQLVETNVGRVQETDDEEYEKNGKVEVVEEVEDNEEKVLVQFVEETNKRFGTVKGYEEEEQEGRDKEDKVVKEHDRRQSKKEKPDGREWENRQLKHSFVKGQVIFPEVKEKERKEELGTKLKKNSETIQKQAGTLTYDCVKYSPNSIVKTDEPNNNWLNNNTDLDTEKNETISVDTTGNSLINNMMGMFCTMGLKDSPKGFYKNGQGHRNEWDTVKDDSNVEHFQRVKGADQSEVKMKIRKQLFAPVEDQIGLKEMEFFTEAETLVNQEQEYKSVTIDDIETELGGDKTGLKDMELFIEANTLTTRKQEGKEVANLNTDVDLGFDIDNVEKFKTQILLLHEYSPEKLTVEENITDSHTGNTISLEEKIICDKDVLYQEPDTTLGDPEIENGTQNIFDECRNTDVNIEEGLLLQATTAQDVLLQLPEENLPTQNNEEESERKDEGIVARDTMQAEIHAMDWSITAVDNSMTKPEEELKPSRESKTESINEESLEMTTTNLEINITKWSNAFIILPHTTNVSDSSRGVFNVLVLDSDFTPTSPDRTQTVVTLNLFPRKAEENLRGHIEVSEENIQMNVKEIYSETGDSIPELLRVAENKVSHQNSVEEDVFLNNSDVNNIDGNLAETKISLDDVNFEVDYTKQIHDEVLTSTKELETMADLEHEDFEPVMVHNFQQPIFQVQETTTNTEVHDKSLLDSGRRDTNKSLENPVTKTEHVKNMQSELFSKSDSDSQIQETVQKENTKEIKDELLSEQFMCFGSDKMVDEKVTTQENVQKELLSNLDELLWPGNEIQEVISKTEKWDAQYDLLSELDGLFTSDDEILEFETDEVIKHHKDNKNGTLTEIRVSSSEGNTFETVNMVGSIKNAEVQYSSKSDNEVSDVFTKTLHQRCLQQEHLSRLDDVFKPQNVQEVIPNKMKVQHDKQDYFSETDEYFNSIKTVQKPITEKIQNKQLEPDFELPQQKTCSPDQSVDKTIDATSDLVLLQNNEDVEIVQTERSESEDGRYQKEQSLEENDWEVTFNDQEVGDEKESTESTESKESKLLNTSSDELIIFISNTNYPEKLEHSYKDYTRQSTVSTIKEDCTSLASNNDASVESCSGSIQGYPNEGDHLVDDKEQFPWNITVSFPNPETMKSECKVLRASYSNIHPEIYNVENETIDGNIVMGGKNPSPYNQNISSVNNPIKTTIKVLQHPQSSKNNSNIHTYTTANGATLEDNTNQYRTTMDIQQNQNQVSTSYVLFQRFGKQESPQTYFELNYDENEWKVGDEITTRTEDEQEKTFVVSYATIEQVNLPQVTTEYLPTIEEATYDDVYNTYSEELPIRPISLSTIQAVELYQDKLSSTEELGVYQLPLTSNQTPPEMPVNNIDQVDSVLPQPNPIPPINQTFYEEEVNQDESLPQFPSSPESWHLSVETNQDIEPIRTQLPQSPSFSPPVNQRWEVGQNEDDKIEQSPPYSHLSPILPPSTMQVTQTSNDPEQTRIEILESTPPVPFTTPKYVHPERLSPKNTPYPLPPTTTVTSTQQDIYHHFPQTIASPEVPPQEDRSAENIPYPLQPPTSTLEIHQEQSNHHIPPTFTQPEIPPENLIPENILYPPAPIITSLKVHPEKRNHHIPSPFTPPEMPREERSSERLPYPTQANPPRESNHVPPAHEPPEIPREERSPEKTPYPPQAKPPSTFTTSFESYHHVPPTFPPPKTLHLETQILHQPSDTIHPQLPPTAVSENRLPVWSFAQSVFHTDGQSKTFFKVIDDRKKCFQSSTFMYRGERIKVSRGVNVFKNSAENQKQDIGNEQNIVNENYEGYSEVWDDGNVMTVDNEVMAEVDRPVTRSTMAYEMASEQDLFNGDESRNCGWFLDLHESPGVRSISPGNLDVIAIEDDITLFGSRSFVSGHHTWVIQALGIFCAVGVCYPGNDVGSWYKGGKWVWTTDGLQYSETSGIRRSEFGQWRNEDVLEISLDCENHKLTMLNTRTNVQASLSGFVGEVYPYFNIYKGTSIRLLETSIE